MVITELLAYLFDSRSPEISTSLANWLTASPRFATFVEMYRDKIRKKIRENRDAGSFRDLQLELEVAYLLLQERRFTLTYEPYGKGKMRGPDFAVTFKTRTTFNLEVTRMRAPIREETLAAQQLAIAGSDGAATANERRLIDVVCKKLGQTVPGMMNVLVVIADGIPISEDQVDSAMKNLKRRAERGDAALFARHGFKDTPDFFRAYVRMSGIVFRTPHDGEVHMPPMLWLNNQAKHPIPPEISRLLSNSGADR